MQFCINKEKKKGHFTSLIYLDPAAFEFVSPAINKLPLLGFSWNAGRFYNSSYLGN